MASLWDSQDKGGRMMFAQLNKKRPRPVVEHRTGLTKPDQTYGE